MAKSWHNQNQPYEYSQVYNNTILVRTITKDDSTDIKYIHSYGATRKTGANTDPSEVYCVFDKGSYYLNVYHQPLGINDYSFEEDGGAINQTDINSYRINGDNVSIYESYTVSSNYASPTSVTSKQGQTNTPLQISHNTTEAVRTGIITVQQVYKGIHYTDTASNALTCTDVEFTQRGKYSYRIVINLDSGYSNTIDHNGTTKYTCYLQRKREGSSWANVPSSTSHEINAAWSCSSGNTTRNYGATITGTVDSSNHYVYHLTVTGCNTRFGTYSGSTISTQNVTITVNYNGNIIYSGTPNSNASNTQSVAVRGVPPYYDYRTYISPTTGTICCDTSRGSYSSTLTFTATFQQCTSTGYADDASSTYGWTSWETVTTTRSDFTWTTSNTTATSITTGILSITAEYNKYHKADTTTTVKAVINSGVTNNQGVAWGSSKVLSTITATKKDHNNTYYCTNITTGNINILGRADLYEYRVVFVDPVEVVYINDGGTHQCDAKLQERKNLGRTNEDGYEWTDIDSTRSHFNWSIATSNGSLTVNSSGRATGTNKNYYVGQSSATPGYTGGTNQSTPCEDKVKATYNQSISRTDSLHNCAAVISISPNNDNSAYIRTKGYMTVYKFSVTISTPTTARIVCANSGRTGGYPTSHTFTANLVYQYRVGTTGSYTWSTAAVMTSAGSNFTWTSNPSATNYYTLSNGTCSNPHTRFNVADTTFTITATAKSSAYNSYNIESGSTYSNTCTLIVLGRADKYEFRVLSVTPNTAKINDQATQTFVAILQQRKNEGNTSQGGTDWETIYNSGSDFNWSSANTNIAQHQSNGTFKGINRNYYDVLNGVEPGKVETTITATCKYNSITRTDNLHSETLTYNLTGYSGTATLQVIGHQAYSAFEVALNLTPNSATICYNNSRIDVQGYTQSITFYPTVTRTYTTGTLDNTFSQTVSFTTTNDNFTWTRSLNDNNIFTLNNGLCTATYLTFSSSRTDRSVIVYAELKASAYSNYRINTNASQPLNKKGQASLTILAREDEITCSSPTWSISPNTINDGGTATITITWNATKNNGQENIDLFNNGANSVVANTDYQWVNVSTNTNNPNSYLSLNTTSGKTVRATGYNKYYKHTLSQFAGNIHFDWFVANKQIGTGKFGAPLIINCSGEYLITVNVNGQKDVCTLDGLECYTGGGNITLSSWNSSVSVQTTKIVVYRDGTLSSWDWDRLHPVRSTGSYISGGSHSNANPSGHSIAQYGGGSSCIIRGTYSSFTEMYDGTVDITVYYHEPNDYNNSNTKSCIFHVTVPPRPDEFRFNAYCSINDSWIHIDESTRWTHYVHLQQNSDSGWHDVDNTDYGSYDEPHEVYTTDDYIEGYTYGCCDVTVSASGTYTLSDRWNNSHQYYLSDSDSDSVCVGYYLYVWAEVNYSGGYQERWSPDISTAEWDGGADGWNTEEPSGWCSGTVHVWWQYEVEEGEWNYGNDYRHGSAQIMGPDSDGDYYCTIEVDYP